MDFPKFEELNPSNCTERSISKHYPEFYAFIKNNYKLNNWTECLYWFYKGLNEYPKCINCGAPTKFISLKNGYREFCSVKCVNNSSIIKNSKKESSLKRWGVENPMKSDEVKEKLKNSVITKYGVDNVFKSDNIKNKIKQTNLEKYGYEYYLSSPECRDKIKQTNLEKYGVIYNSQNQDIKDSIKKTCQERYNGIGFESPELMRKYKNTLINRYGDDNIYYIDGVKEKIIKSLKQRLINKYEELINVSDDFIYTCKCPHKNCNKCSEKLYKISSKNFLNRKQHNSELCTILNPENSYHNKNTIVEMFVRDILDEYNIKYETNVRGLVGKQEIDIYIPTLKIGFECNGIYWHDSKHKKSSYHKNKTSKALEVGIKLYHIWEDWIITKPDIIKSMIINWIGKNPNKIYARNCSVKIVPKDIYKDFVIHNHIQGDAKCSICYGLYYNDELVSIMSFGKTRGCINIKGNDQDSYELIRFCSKLNTTVIGSASKLLKHFIKDYNPITIHTYASRDISTGNLYKLLGFTSDNKITNSYWYIEHKTYKRFHRTAFTKDSIIKRGWRDIKDNTWTESDVMVTMGYYKIFDSGQIKWIYNKI